MVEVSGSTKSPLCDSAVDPEITDVWGRNNGIFISLAEVTKAAFKSKNFLQPQ